MRCTWSKLRQIVSVTRFGEILLLGLFWAMLGYFWLFLAYFGLFGLFWAILGYFGLFWAILGYFGQFFAILGYFLNGQFSSKQAVSSRGLL